MSIRAAARCAAVAVIAACGASDRAPADGAARVTVDTTATGVVVVRNVGPAPEWRLEPVASIGAVGAAGGPRPDEFGRVASVLADAGRRVYVADATARSIRRFGPDGEFIDSIGRRGAGPGEFGGLQSLAWVGDTLAAMDAGNARIGLFARDGRWLGAWRYQPVTGPAVRLWDVAPDEFYAYGVRSGAAGLDAVYIRFTSAGAADTLPYPRPPERHPTTIVCRSAGAIRFFDVPYAPRVLHSPAPDGMLAMAWTGEYRLAFVRPDGDTTRVIERAHEPAPLSDREWADGVGAYLRFREANPDAACEPREPTRPEAKPAIRSLFFDAAGRVWVEAVTPGGIVLDVFDASGRLIGSAPAPERDPRVPPYVRGDRVYIAVRDSLDVQSIRIFTVGPAL